jgi:hypothetical protein
MGCLVNLSDFTKSKFLDFDSKPFCQRCFDALPADPKKNITKYKEKEKEYK